MYSTKRQVHKQGVASATADFFSRLLRQIAEEGAAGSISPTCTADFRARTVGLAALPARASLFADRSDAGITTIPVLRGGESPAFFTQTSGR